MLRFFCRCGFVLFGCFFSLVADSTAWADEEKLQPLRYNNPGLEVDLGVGLWAWPLPLDFDDDGDLDLVVSCPDKPSNGLWYFENPSQDPHEPLPVFKPAVWLGPTGHNVQVSHVDGRPRLLRENVEYPRFRETGTAGDGGVAIYPNGSFHAGNTRARMWRLVDWEGDGDQDLLVGIGDWSDYVWDQAYDAEGRWRNGPLHGWVYLIENVEGVYSDTPRKVLRRLADRCVRVAEPQPGRLRWGWRPRSDLRRVSRWLHLLLQRRDP